MGQSAAAACSVGNQPGSWAVQANGSVYGVQSTLNSHIEITESII